MGTASIDDHVRTPRGRGKPTGVLHEVTPIRLIGHVLTALKDRAGLPGEPA